MADGLEGLARIRHAWLRQEGQGMVEYAVILALISLVIITMLVTLGRKLGSLYSNIQCAFPNAGCP